MKIKVLRGIHTINMVDDVVKAATGANVIFVELVASKKAKQEAGTYLNSISGDKNFAAKLEPTALENHPNAYVRIAWQLRGQNILFVPVNDSTEEGEDLQQIFDDRITGAFSDEELQELITTKDFDIFYEAVDARVGAFARNILRRDQLVASQIRNSVAYCTEHGITHDRLVLVQGYLHNTTPLLKNMLPSYEVEEHLYNQAALTDLKYDPFTQLTIQKLRHLNEPCKPVSIDRLICFIYEVSKRDAGPIGVVTNNDDEAFKSFQDFAAEMQPIKEKLWKMSPEELHAQAEKVVNQNMLEAMFDQPSKKEQQL